MSRKCTSCAVRGLWPLVLAALCLAPLCAAPPPAAQAAGEASTRFGVFVPATDYEDYEATLVVTAVSGGTAVTIRDTGQDGDTDDTSGPHTLDAGQSVIIGIRNGLVNDDLDGKQDGDFFLVEASQPVIVASLTTGTDWQHAFVPADNRRMTGTSFYLYRPPGFSNAAEKSNLLNVFAYNDRTEVRVIDITRGRGTTDAGRTSVLPDADGKVVLSAILDTGQDLLEVLQRKARLGEGRTYHIVASNDVSVQFGSLGKAQSGSRDGGAYVPGKSGTTADRTFYFTLPYEQLGEREMRLVSYDQPARVAVRGWNTALSQWDIVAELDLPAFGHAELVGKALGVYQGTAQAEGYYLFEVTSNATISLFEASWLETGAYGTSDIATFISSKDGPGAGTAFQTYLGPPSFHPYTKTRLSHLIVSAHQTATVEVADPDSYGEYVELYNNSSAEVDLAGWSLTNAAGRQAVLPAGTSIKPGAAVLLSYHPKAASVAPDYAYGEDYPDFRLANGRDSLALRDASGAVVDSLDYTEAGWLSHGIYRALERRDPNRAFTADNAADATLFTATSPDNLGAYYGSPGQHTGSPGLLTGTVVINEAMSGRIYRQFTVAAGSYYDFSLNDQEWQGLHNGDQPGVDTISSAERPENPYLIVQSDAPVSVMNSNWNDNWMAYATGLLVPDPEVNALADRTRYPPGGTARLTVLATNHYADLYDPALSIALPVEFGYQKGGHAVSPSLEDAKFELTQQANGSWMLTWRKSGVMGAGILQRFRVDITGTIPADADDGALAPAVASLAGADAAGQRYASQDTAMIAVDKEQPIASSDLLVNEVLAAPGCDGGQWIELVNRGTSSLPLAGRELASVLGLVYRFPDDAPDLTPNGYLVVALSDGQDVTATQPMWFHAGRDTAGLLMPGEDQVALFDGSLRLPDALLSYLRWDTDAEPSYKGDLDLAVSAGLWPSRSDYAPAPDEGQSLNRQTNGGVIVDTHSPKDWTAGTPTPGQLNAPDLPAPRPQPVSRFSAAPLMGQPGAIHLTWTNPATGFDQVRIVRSAGGYPARLDEGALVYAGNAESFTDTGLEARRAPGEPAMAVLPSIPLYYYSAFSVLGGAVACPAPDAQTQAMPAHYARLAYEDQKGSGWSDWDTNDLVVRQDTAVYLNRDGVQRLEARFEAEARGAAYDHAMSLTVPLDGPAWVEIRRYDAAGALAGVEGFRSDGPIEAAVFTSTHTALPSNPGTFSSNTVSGTRRIPGLSARIVITPLDPAANPAWLVGAPPFDPWIRVRETGADIHLMGAGSIGNSQMVRHAGSPLNGRDLPLALDFARAWNWPLEERAIWQAYPRYTSFVTSSGQLDADWFTRPDPSHLWTTYSTTVALHVVVGPPNPRMEGSIQASTGWPQAMGDPIFASPVMADLDADGRQELIAASQSGLVSVWNADGALQWSRVIGGIVRGTPSVGDVDADGRAEVVIGSGDGLVHAWKDDGGILPGFPKWLGQPIRSAVALFQADEDPELEMALQAGDARVYLLNHLGEVLPGWPVSTNGVPDAYGGVILASTPAAGDLDADGRPEIVAGSTDGRVYAWRLDGTPASRLWPRATGDWVYGSPVLVDLNLDGYRDVVATSGDGRVYAWRGDGAALPGFPVRLGGGIVSSPAVFDLDGDGDLEIVTGALDGRAYALHHTGNGVAGWPQATAGGIYASPVAADINSDGYPEVIIGSRDGGVYAWRRDGSAVAGWPKRADDWVIATPAAADLDGDHRVDVAVASFDGRVHVWRQPGIAHSQAIVWGTFRYRPDQNSTVGTRIALQPPPVAKFAFLPFLFKH